MNTLPVAVQVTLCIGAFITLWYLLAKFFALFGGKEKK